MGKKDDNKDDVYVTIKVSKYFCETVDIVARKYGLKRETFCGYMLGLGYVATMYMWDNLLPENRP